MADRIDSVAVDQLLLYVIEEVRLTDRFVALAWVKFDRGAGCLIGLLGGYIALLFHLTDYLVAALDRGGWIEQRVVEGGSLGKS